MDCAQFFWLCSHIFHPWPCKKSKSLEIGEKYNPKPFSICFVCFPTLFFPILWWWILRFFLLRSHLFHLWPCQKSGNLEIGCRLSTAECAAECCWVCCWVLLSAAEKFNSQLFSICFVCVVPIVLSRVHCFSIFWDGFCVFLGGFVLTPVTPDCKKSGNLEIGCRLSTAECCWVLLSVLLSAA